MLLCFDVTHTIIARVLGVLVVFYFQKKYYEYFCLLVAIITVTTEAVQLKHVRYSSHYVLSKVMFTSFEQAFVP